jgi:signal transduction histidine kinase
MGYSWAAIHVFRDGHGQKELPFEAAGTADRESPPRPGAGRDRPLLPSPAVLSADPCFLEARASGEPLLAERHDLAGGSPLFFLPLPTERRLGGMLVVGAKRLRPDDLDVLRGVAQSVALAMENAILYRRVSSQARRLDYTLVTIDSLSRTLTRTTHGLMAFLEELVATVGNVTVAQHVVVLGSGLNRAVAGQAPLLVPLWWSGRARERGFPVDPREPATGLRDALEDREEPFWLEEPLLEELRQAGDEIGLAGRGTARALCIPMRRGRQLEGAILALFHTARELAPREKEMLTILGNQVSVGLENTQLYEEGERLRRQAEAHYRVAMEQKLEAERNYEELQRALHRISAIEKQRILQEERARIAQELHDSVAQVLYSLGLNLDWCRSQAPEGSALQERLGVLKEMAAGCVQEMRQSIFELSPAVTEYGLAAALQRLMEEYPRLTGVALTAEIGELPELTSSEQNDIYRIVQESLFNIFKHARASQATLSLRTSEQILELRIADDGVGMAGGGWGATTTQLEASFGLSGMRRRAEALGAGFEVESEPGRGTTVRLCLPLGGPSPHGQS